MADDGREDSRESSSPLVKQGAESPPLSTGSKRAQPEDNFAQSQGLGSKASTPVPAGLSAPTRIAERARLSLKGARAVAGKTIQRWTSNIATAASQAGSSLVDGQLYESQSSQSPSSSPPPAPSTNSARVSQSLTVSDTTLLKIASQAPGCLFEDKFVSRFKRDNKNDLGEKRYRLVEVQFKDRAGLTLDVSQAYPSHIFVDGFSSDESPALLSDAIMVGDTLLSASGGDRWLRSTGHLDIISQFIRDCARPVTIRFLRDLKPPLTLADVHADPSKAAFWLDFLAENSTISSSTPGTPGASEQEQVYTVDPETAQLRSIWDGRALAQFSLDARFSAKTEDAMDAIVERHLPFARTAAEQMLIDWHQARGSRSTTELEDTSDSSLSRGVLPPGMTVFDVLKSASEAIEEALVQAYFKRFLHSQQALALFREFQIAFERPALEACATEVSLEAVLSRRPLANLFLAHCLPRFRGVHPKLLLWMEIEYSLRPAIEASDEAFNAWGGKHEPEEETSGVSEVGSMMKQIGEQGRQRDALRDVWVASSRIYERFLSPKGACYCGELSNNANANIWAASSAFSRETWGETGFCTCCGRESRLLLNDLSERVEAMRNDPTDVGFLSLESLRQLASSIQAETVEFLRIPFGQFTQDPTSWFSVVVESFNAEVASSATSSESQTLVPRFSTVLQHGVPLPRGVETHRAPLDYFEVLKDGNSILEDILGIARFTFDERAQSGKLVETVYGDVSDGLGKFAFPWGNSNSSESSRVERTSSNATAEQSPTEEREQDTVDGGTGKLIAREELCFNFVLGSERLRGACHVTSNGTNALVLISRSPLFARLRHILMLYESGQLHFGTSSHLNGKPASTAPEPDLLSFDESSFGEPTSQVKEQSEGQIVEARANGKVVEDVMMAKISMKGPRSECLECGNPLTTTVKPNFWFPSRLPNDFSFDALLESLSLRNIIAVFASLLLEKKVLLISSSYTVLTVVGESLCSLLHPLRWSHVYAPMLPRKMLDLIMCPTPFLIGIHASYAFKSDFPFATDLIVVDLDLDDVTTPQILPRLPLTYERDLLRKAKQAQCLFSNKADDLGFNMNEMPSLDRKKRDESIKEAFRSVILGLLANVHLACFSVEHRGETVTFIDERFWLESRKTDEYEFLISLLRTQAFSSFVGGMRS